MNLRLFDLNLLVLFEAIWDERSVSRAAGRLGLGQPAASAALARLRHLTGDDLFVRSGGKMCPTPRAIELIEVVKTSLARIRGALDQSQKFDAAKSEATFTLGHNDYTALATLRPFVSHVRRLAPGVTLRLFSYEKDDLAAMLETGKIDLAVGVFPDAPESCVCTPLFTETFIGVASRHHPGFRRGMSTDAGMFAEVPQALMTLRRDAKGYIDERLAELGLKRRVHLTGPNLFAIAAGITDSDLVAVLPRRAANIVEALGLVTFELPFATEPWTVSMLWHSTKRTDPSQLWLRAALRDACGEDKTIASDHRPAVAESRGGGQSLMGHHDVAGPRSELKQSSFGRDHQPEA